MRPVFFMLLLAAASASAQQQCDVNGVAVNPANGHTTQDKTGIMKCRLENGKLKREQEIRNGKFMGLVRFYNDDGSWTEHNTNERGNRHGRAREFFADGQLRRDETFDNGSNTGLAIRYFPNGLPERRTFYEGGREIAAIDFQLDGRLARLRCAPRSVMPEDRALCGFHGNASDLTLYSAQGAVVAKESWQEGVLVSRVELDEAGNPRRSLSLDGGMRTTREYYRDGRVRLETSYKEGTVNRRTGPREGMEREWSPEGQKIRETVWRNGFRSDVTQWYMNGNIKEKMHAESGERDARVTTEYFWDTGKPQSKEVAHGRNLVGMQTYYNEEGQLKTQAFYVDGVLKNRKDFDAAGKLVKEEEFYADGSRKLK